MCERFLKFIPSEEAFWLMKRKPNAFYLLSQVANTARRYNGGPDGLTVGQCHLKASYKYEMTEGQYRAAKKILTSRKHLKILETNRTRKKSTTGTTTDSTLVELCSTTVYDINSESNDNRNNDRTTTERQLNDNKQERRRRDISKDISNKEDALRDGAHPASPIRSRDLLFFDFEKWEFVGITDIDMANWKIMYPHIDLHVETLKATQWLKNNPSRNNKKQWRKYLTGWYGRSNDSIENKKAFRNASGSNGQDRRTKDIHGNPVDSPHDGRF
jgi:hypothetical protein